MPTTTTNYGRQNISWPDLGFDPGALLHSEIVGSVELISNQISRYWSGSQALVASGTANLIHNFNLPLTQLRVRIFESNAELSDALDSGFLLTNISNSTISIQNTGGSTRTIEVYIEPRTRMRGEDLDPALAISTTGNATFNDVTVSGNLTVNGTATTINTATLEVEDKNILVNNGGTDGTAEGAGLDVEGTGNVVVGSLKYEAALASRWKVGANGTEKQIVTVSDTQVITEKDIDGGTASNARRITLPSNTKTNLDGLTRKAGTVAYATDGAKAYIDDGSAFRQLLSLDANLNLTANNIVNNYATTATAAGTTALTVASKMAQFFTGSTTQTVMLPVVSTLALGHTFYIRNLSTGTVTVQSSGANTVLACQPGEWLTVTCILTSGTTAASWSTFAKLALNPVATGALSLPSGTAAQRPTAVAGQVRLNTDSNSFEGYANGIWSSIGGGLNELPQKNYLKTWSESAVSPGTLSQLGSTTANLVSLTAFYTDSTSSTSALAASTDSTLRGAVNYLSSISGSNTNGSRFFQFPAQQLEGSDLGKPISISFDVAGVTTDGNWDAVIVRYNSSGVYQNTLSIAGNVSSASAFPSAKLPTGTTTFNGFFVPDSTTASDIYALRLRSLANAVNIRIDTLFIGPQPVRTGAAITDPVSYTPILGLTGLTGDGKWWREGAFLCVHGSAVYASAVSGTSLTVSIPSGLTIDTSALPTLNELVLGTVGGIDNGVAWVGGWIGYNTTTTVIIYAKTATTYQYGTVTASAPFTLAAGDRFNWQFKVPITGWSSNTTMLSNPNISVDSAGFIQAFAGATVPNGWVLCDGTAINRSTYFELFNKIGTTWGVGDGSTTFNLPNISCDNSLGFVLYYIIKT
jgi:hypothetical protein